MASVVVNGDTSGAVTLSAPAVAGTVTVTLPDASGTMLTSVSPGYNGFKNRIINGAMAISQRGTSFTTGAGSAYMVDRWQVGATQVSKITGTQSTTSTNGFTYSQGLTVASAFSSGAGDIFYFTQGIEGFNIADLGWGTANAAPITISFWIRGSLTGTYSAFVRNSARNRCYIATFTINSANTFEQKIITIAGDTSGTWTTDNTEGINFGIDLGSGTNYNGTASTWTGSNVFRTSGSVSWVANASATLFLTGVQLEKGSTATSFDYRPYGTELILAQRYFETTYPIGTAVGTASADASAPVAYSMGDSGSVTQQIIWMYKVKKRSAPDVTVYNPNTGATGSARYAGSTNINFSAQGSRVDQATFGSGTAGMAINNTFSYYLTASSEL